MFGAGYEVSRGLCQSDQAGSGIVSMPTSRCNDKAPSRSFLVGLLGNEDGSKTAALSMTFPCSERITRINIDDQAFWTYERLFVLTSPPLISTSTLNSVTVFN